MLRPILTCLLITGLLLSAGFARAGEPASALPESWSAPPEDPTVLTVADADLSQTAVIDSLSSTSLANSAPPELSASEQIQRSIDELKREVALARRQAPELEAEAKSKANALLAEADRLELESKKMRASRRQSTPASTQGGFAASFLPPRTEAEALEAQARSLRAEANEMLDEAARLRRHATGMQREIKRLENHLARIKRAERRAH